MSRQTTHNMKSSSNKQLNKTLGAQEEVWSNLNFAEWVTGIKAVDSFPFSSQCDLWHITYTINNKSTLTKLRGFESLGKADNNLLINMALLYTFHIMLGLSWVCMC